CDAVQLTRKIGCIDVARRQVGGGAVVPERNGAGLPLETHCVLGSHYLFEKQLQQVLALPRGKSDDALEERRADKQRATPAFRMDPHQRVVTDQFPGFYLLDEGVLRLAAFWRSEAMFADQGIQIPPQRFGQALIRRFQIRPLGIPPIGRYIHSSKDGSGRRVDRGGDVGMPAGPGAQGTRFGKSCGIAITGNRVDLWEALLVTEYRVTYRGLAEVLGKADVLGMGQRLVTEENHLPAHQRFAYLPDCLLGQRGGEVYITDLRADMHGQGPDADRLRFRGGQLGCSRKS